MKFSQYFPKGVIIVHCNEAGSRAMGLPNPIFLIEPLEKFLYELGQSV